MSLSFRNIVALTRPRPWLYWFRLGAVQSSEKGIAERMSSVKPAGAYRSLSWLFATGLLDVWNVDGVQHFVVVVKSIWSGPEFSSA